ncbi:MAG TPA: LON peptidase substrate-binding domain-containing protein, partial [Prolixibacteraceae bacterium]|nr:LON peptidase substrate-binding domain-containing protein [Prolixibacteraceae bacterium]
MSEQSIKDTKSFVFSGIGGDDSEFIPIMADGGEDDLLVKNMPDTLPILPLRNTVLFPGVVFPISVGRIKSLKLVREVYQSNGVLGVIAQQNPDVDEPGANDLHKIGTIAKILKILEMPDGNTTVIIQGKQRFRLQEMVTDEPYHRANVEKLEEFKPEVNTSEFKAIVESLKDIAI